VAVARIALPHAVIRLSAGRESMSEATQALCFAAGANSIFLGARLLTTANAPFHPTSTCWPGWVWAAPATV
jgi:biotin synthase